jgi:hypothetical protein
MTQPDCDNAEAGLEFLPLPIWDMGTIVDSTGNNPKNIATGMYFYDDRTSPFRVPGSIWEPFTEVATSGVPPISDNGQVAAEVPPNAVGRCGEDVSDKFSPNVHHAIHVVGGPFIEWGGGMGRMLKCMNSDSTGSAPELLPWLPSLNLNKYLCGARKSIISSKGTQDSYAACVTDFSTAPTPNPDLDVMKTVCPKRDQYYQTNKKADETDEPYLVGMALDMSQWDGIAFWARRSPNSQEGIRLAVADKYVDDDMSYLSYKYDKNRPRYCERKTVCSCPNHKPCTSVQVVDNQYDVDGNRLKWAAKTSGDNSVRGKIAVGADGRSLLNMSGDPATDASGKPLTLPDGTAPTAFEGYDKNGEPYETDVMPLVTRQFCFDPAVDPIPPVGTPYSQVTDRAYRNQWLTTFSDYDFTPCGQGSFCNTAPAGNRSDYSFVPPNITDGHPVQLPFPSSNATESPGFNYIPCGDTACNEEYPSFQAVDPQSYGRTCNDFAFEGSITYGYCYTPGADPNPAEGALSCGDYWMKSVNLSTDWELIKVPFNTLVQQGWAKRQYQFDLTALTDVRLEWDRGWLDVWISDVRFYRNKQ